MKMRSVGTPVKILLTTSFLTLASSENTSPDAITVHLGVHVVYDRAIYEGIRNPHGHEQPEDVGTPNDYFAAFLSSVQLTFRNITNPHINIYLVNATLLNEDKALKVLVSHSTYDDTIEGKATVSKLYKEVSSDKSDLYRDADILFLVTTKYISTMFEEMNLHFGVPGTGGVCNDSNNIGLVTDDGITFKGVEDMALQIAVLLGASLQSNCSKRDNAMPPSVFADGTSTLTDCSAKEILGFITKTKDSDDSDVCWKILPENIAPSQKVLPAVYNNITRYDVCTAGTTARYRDVQKCRPGDGRSSFNSTCRVQCCEYNSRFAKKGQPIFLYGRKLADGAPCGDDKICVFGRCENRYKAVQ